MENSLRRQLAAIKKRAMMLRRRGEARSGAANEIIDDIVKTGVVVRGADVDPLRSVRRRWPWRRDDAASGTEFNIDQFKTGEPRPIESVVPGFARTIDGCSYYLVRPVGREIDPGSLSEASRFAALTGWPDDVNCTVAGVRRGRRATKAARREFDFNPARVLFLDIETAGLSANTYLFLCGMMFFEGSDFVVEQVFARDYEEELGLLRYVRHMMERFDVVVTYNGASFDLPFIRTRMAIHRVPDPGVFGSVDLLHAARRAYRDTLPNCKLVTVEHYLRGFERTDDIPSRFIPMAYHDYVATSDARVIKHVLYHNRMDLFTMAVIVNRLAHRAGQPAPKP